MNEEPRKTGDPTWPPFLLAPLVTTIQKAIATPSSEDTKFFTKEQNKKGKKNYLNLKRKFQSNIYIESHHYDSSVSVQQWQVCQVLCVCVDFDQGIPKLGGLKEHLKCRVLGKGIR